MLSTELHEAAVEFGRALRQAPAVATYRSPSRRSTLTSPPRG
jgi:hypothetical protein